MSSRIIPGTVEIADRFTDKPFEALIINQETTEPNPVRLFAAIQLAESTHHQIDRGRRLVLSGLPAAIMAYPGEVAGIFPVQITAEMARQNLVDAMSRGAVAISHAVIVELMGIPESDETNFTWTTIGESRVKITGQDLQDYVVDKAREVIIFDNGEIGKITIPNRHADENSIEALLPYNGQFEVVATIRF
ncbi:MAG TPA: hypothetical protein VLG47_03470 [Candidatus Saccharimonadales bacterium]|nr:hypothetical protein [Candidatus Saccharimonadales bacterium]